MSGSDEAKAGRRRRRRTGVQEDLGENIAQSAVVGVEVPSKENEKHVERGLGMRGKGIANHEVGEAADSLMEGNGECLEVRGKEKRGTKGDCRMYCMMVLRVQRSRERDHNRSSQRQTALERNLRGWEKKET